MSYGDGRGHQFGLHDPRAPWRRAARPLAILFVVQLSGVGCAARAPEIPTPTKPDELAPYLTVYQDQLESEGITLEGAEEYLAGRTSSPLPEGRRENGRSAPEADVAIADVAGQGPAGEATFKMIDGVAEYRIGPGDVIGITTFLGPETPAAVNFRVPTDGSIYITRFDIGAVRATGQTPTELSRTLTDAYRHYVRTGFAEARVLEYHAWSALLTGEIEGTGGEGPGGYPLDGRVTVADFIYRHGGPANTADLGDVRVLRQGSEQRVDVAAVLAGTADDPPLYSGDIVHVPSIEQGSNRIFIFGEVGTPGVYSHTEGLSVLDAIAQAGGWTANANRESVYISRPTTGETIPVNLDVTLGTGQAAAAPQVEAGDFIVVPLTEDRSQTIRDWIGIFSLILSALTIIELIRR